MKVRILAAVAALALGTAISGGSANATTYLLSNPGGSFGSVSDFGTVTVTQTANGLHFDALLLSPYVFVTTGQHVTFAGNLGGTITGLADGVAGDNVSNSNFTFASSAAGGISNSPFNNDFDFSVDCQTGSQSATCGNNGGGGTHAFGKELIFDILGTNLKVLPSSNDGSIYFSADVYDTTQVTGNTGVIGAGGGVPEPATWGLLIAGFGAIGASMRMQRRQAATLA
jgi:hypothetical protein